MKISLIIRRARKPRENRGAPFFLRLVAGLVCLCVGIGLFLPVIKNWGAPAHRIPRGQFLADVRTLVAGAHYLFGSDADLKTNPVEFTTRPPERVQCTSNGCPEIPDDYSNRTGQLDCPSNSPA